MNLFIKKIKIKEYEDIYNDKFLFLWREKYIILKGYGYIYFYIWSVYNVWEMYY